MTVLVAAQTKVGEACCIRSESHREGFPSRDETIVSKPFGVETVDHDTRSLKLTSLA